ncbi:MAG: aspartate kinase [Gammaproteobacteria bacterium]|nr:aspartate kinase [Gammaproteobacteria bacterium]MCY4278022.1 aspartate kinase [Gammaproteobacteria bacterium]MCY4322167.1 aspartate kinase [Gammaproteobacteria bacterium]
MALYVQKYGGTSVGSLERIESVADRIDRWLASGHRVVVVVSAMAGETDRLIDMGGRLGAEGGGREMDMLMSAGEQVSIALLALALRARGHASRSYLGSQVAIRTDGSHMRARIVDMDTRHLSADLDKSVVPVIAGFQGVGPDGEITTLGRGGSDTTAVAVAYALKAHECQIFTDVDGVYTADPRIVSSARRLDAITIEEMQELSSLGSKVLAVRSVEFANKYKVPLRVLSSFVEDDSQNTGTLITHEETAMEQPLVSGVTYSKDEAKITFVGVPDTPGVASDILGPVGDAGIEVDMIVQNTALDGHTDFTFTVRRQDFSHVMRLVRDVRDRVGGREVVGDDDIVKLSVVGVGMRSHAGVATKMFDALAKEGINIQMVSTSEIKISVVIAERYLELGVRCVHSAFGLDQ